MKRTFLIDPQGNRNWPQVISNVVHAINDWIKGGPVQITLDEPKRTLDANSAMWATLADIARQVEWPHTKGGNWTIGLMDSDSWKAILTAAFEQETKQAQGIGGGTVMLGARTSQYSRRKMGEFIEFVQAFGTERGVKWSASAQDEMAQFAPPSRRVA
nr:recombination protein NinB [Stenotrophomonas geniculata]